jgi:hypothetical protein
MTNQRKATSDAELKDTHWPLLNLRLSQFHICELSVPPTLSWMTLPKRKYWKRFG